MQAVLLNQEYRRIESRAWARMCDMRVYSPPVMTFGRSADGDMVPRLRRPDEKVNYFHEDAAIDSYIRPEHTYYYDKWFRFTVGLRARGAAEELAATQNAMRALVADKWPLVKRLWSTNPKKVQLYEEVGALAEREEMARRKTHAVDNYCKVYVQRMRVLRGGTSGVWSPNEFQNFSMVRKILWRRIVRVKRDGTRNKQALVRAWGYDFRVGYRAGINWHTSGVVYRFYFIKCNQTKRGVGYAFNQYSFPKSISMNSFVVKAEIVRIVNSFTVRYLRRWMPFENVPHHILERIMLASVESTYSKCSPENHLMHAFIEKVYKCLVSLRKPGVRQKYVGLFDRIRSAIMRVDQPERHKRLLGVGDVVDVEGGTYAQRSGEIIQMCAVKVSVALYETTAPAVEPNLNPTSIETEGGAARAVGAPIRVVKGTHVGRRGHIRVLAARCYSAAMVKVHLVPHCLPPRDVIIDPKNVVKRMTNTNADADDE